MLCNRSINKLLNMPDNFQILNHASIEMYVQIAQSEHTCPHCGHITNKIHDYRNQKVKDIPLQRKAFYIIFGKLRYSPLYRYAEGCNNRLKVLKRISYGFRNFDILRKRLLYISNNSKKKRSTRLNANGYFSYRVTFLPQRLTLKHMSFAIAICNTSNLHKFKNIKQEPS